MSKISNSSIRLTLALVSIILLVGCVDVEEKNRENRKQIALKHIETGKAFEKEGKHQEALDYYRKARASSPDVPTAELIKNAEEKIERTKKKRIEELNKILAAKKALENPKFEFITSVSGEAIYIESTPMEEYKTHAGTDVDEYKRRGGIVQTDKEKFKISPESIAGIVVNALDSKYTLISEIGISTIMPEGFYYNVDKGCSDDTINVKLIPADASTSLDSSESVIAVIKQPHLAIEYSKIVSFAETEMPKKLKSSLPEMLDKAYEDFIEKTKAEKSTSDNWRSYYASDLFPPEPSANELEIHFYTSKDYLHKFISANWSRGGGGLGMLSGLFLLDDSGSDIKLHEVVPMYTDGIGVTMELKNMILINDRAFAFVDIWGWEWKSEAIYEATLEGKPWVPYAESRGGGGC